MASERGLASWRRLSAPRRDAGALGFGLAFLLLGSGGLVRVAGGHVEPEWLCQLALIGLGLAGLASLSTRAFRPRREQV